MLSRVGLDLPLRLLLLLAHGCCSLGFGPACPFCFGTVGHDGRHLGATDDAVQAENAFGVVNPSCLEAPALRVLSVSRHRAESGSQPAVPAFVGAFGLE